jgi:hypothetical protein
VSRILSSSALICLELYEDSTQIQLFAYGSESRESNARTTGIPVGVYKLPGGMDSTIARMECSQVSLSGKRKDRGINHLLEDVEGIFTISLGRPDPCAVTGRPDNMEWNIACGMVRPFHNAAVAALLQKRRSGEPGTAREALQTPVHEYKDWANDMLSWLPAGTEPPTRHAICGYRLATAVNASEEVAPDEKYKAVVRLTIFNFTPAHVARELSAASINCEMADLPETRLGDTQSLAEGSPADSQPPAASAVITMSSPNRGGQPLFEHATKSPYLMASRNIRLAARAEGPMVLHLTQDQLVLLQVRCSTRHMPT